MENIKDIMSELSLYNPRGTMNDLGDNDLGDFPKDFSVSEETNLSILLGALGTLGLGNLDHDTKLSLAKGVSDGYIAHSDIVDAQGTYNSFKELHPPSTYDFNFN